jgi:hypothetical protein
MNLHLQKIQYFVIYVESIEYTKSTEKKINSTHI